MKASVETLNGLKIDGKLCSVQSYIVTLDVPRKLIDRESITAYFNEKISVTEHGNEWRVIIDRSKVKSIKFND